MALLVQSGVQIQQVGRHLVRDPAVALAQEFQKVQPAALNDRVEPMNVSTHPSAAEDFKADGAVVESEARRLVSIGLRPSQLRTAVGRAGTMNYRRRALAADVSSKRKGD